MTKDLLTLKPELDPAWGLALRRAEFIALSDCAGWIGQDCPICGGSGRGVLFGPCEGCDGWGAVYLPPRVAA